MCPPLTLLEDTLAWRHMAPTAPDTLPCYPFCHNDPFIIKETPHVYFTANQVRPLSSATQPDTPTVVIQVRPLPTTQPDTPTAVTRMIGPWSSTTTEPDTLTAVTRIISPWSSTTTEPDTPTVLSLV